MLKSPKHPSLSPYERELRNQRIQVARPVIAIAAVTGVILFFLHHTSVHVQGWSVHMPSLSRTEYDCLWLFGSLLFAYFVLQDIRSGVSRFGRINIFPYTRSSDPVGYWILIAFHGALAVGMFIASCGDMLGFWNISG